MQITIHNIQTIQEEGSWYKIGGEIKLDTDADKFQIERIAAIIGVEPALVYFAPGVVDPLVLQWIARKFIEYIIAADLNERKQAR